MAHSCIAIEDRGALLTSVAAVRKISTSLAPHTNGPRSSCHVSNRIGRVCHRIEACRQVITSMARRCSTLHVSVIGGALATQLAPDYRFLAMQKAHLPVLTANHIDMALQGSFLLAGEINCPMRTAAEVIASSPLPHTHTSANAARLKN